MHYFFLISVSSCLRIRLMREKGIASGTQSL